MFDSNSSTCIAIVGKDKTVSAYGLVEMVVADELFAVRRIDDDFPDSSG
jgi:hypothetical protein